MFKAFSNLLRFNRNAPAPIARPDPDNEPLALYFTPHGEIRSITTKSLRAGYIEGVSGGFNSQQLLTYSEPGYAFASIINVWVGRCLQIRADSTDRLNWYVEDKITHKRLPNHPLTRAMERSGQSIIWRIRRSLDVYGEIYIKPLINDYNYYSDVQWLNNLTTEPIVTADGIERIIYTPTYGGRTYNWSIDQVAYWHSFNPFNDLRGVSLMIAAMKYAMVDEQIISAAEAHYKNDARPGLMLLMEYDMADKRSTAFIDWWKANYQGTKNANKIAMLPKVVRDVKTLERTAIADDEKTTMNVRRNICAVFGVPLSIAGAWDDAQYQSAPEQRKSLYEETIIPGAEQIARDASIELLPYFGDPERERVWFDARPILALMEDQTAKTANATQQLMSGGITVNQYREVGGMPPLPTGDVLYVPAGVIVTPVDKLGSMPAPEPPGGGSPFGFGAGMNTATAPVEDVDPLKDAPGAAIVLALDDNIDLIAQQKILKQRLAGQPVRWNDSKTFHMTLLSSPAVDDETLDMIKQSLSDYPLPDLKLNIGSLASFDRIGEHALHFRLRSNESLARLKDYQEQLYIACDAAGLKMTDTSAPASWIPHVTMGYAPSRIRRQPYQTNLNVTPVEMRLSVEDGDGYKVLYRSAIPNADGGIQPIEELPDAVQGKAVDTPIDEGLAIDSALFELALPIIDTPETFAVAKMELAAYEKFLFNRRGKNPPNRSTFKSQVCPTALIDALAIEVQKLKTKAQVHDLFSSLVQALEDAVMLKKKADDDSDIITPEQAQVWWHDYDTLMKEVGSVWLDDYMRQVWEKLENKINSNLKPSDVGKLLREFHSEVTEAWTGTEDNPGVIARLFMAGMGAGQQALVRRNTNMNPVKAVTVDWTLVPKDAIAAVQKYVGKLIRGIDRTTLDDVQKIIAAWLESGLPVSDLTAALAPVFKDPKRAAVIAQTESNRAYTEGAIERWKEADVTKVKWVTVSDGSVCLECRSLAGQVSTIETGFGDEGAFPPKHPNCRCFIKPVLQ